MILPNTKVPEFYFDTPAFPVVGTHLAWPDTATQATRLLLVETVLIWLDQTCVSTDPEFRRSPAVVVRLLVREVDPSTLEGIQN
jgi:hypothetical protein